MCAFFSLVVVPIVLVGNMKDLQNVEEDGLSHTADAYVKALENHVYGYLECSAKQNKGVWQVFEMAAEAIIENEKRNDSLFPITFI